MIIVMNFDIGLARNHYLSFFFFSYFEIVKRSFNCSYHSYHVAMIVFRFRFIH